MFNPVRKTDHKERIVTAAQEIGDGLKRTLNALQNKREFDDTEKSEFVALIAQALEVQTIIATKPIEDEAGRFNRKALGYVYGFIDAALRVIGQDMADASVGVPITYLIVRKLWPNRVDKFVDYLFEHGSDDAVVMAGVMRGGQQYLDWLKPGATMLPMGLAKYLSEADVQSG